MDAVNLDSQEGKDLFIGHMKKLGLDASEAYLVLDLMQHAKKESMDKIKEVSSRAPQHLQSLIFYLTLDCFRQFAQAHPDVEMLLEYAVLRILLHKEMEKAKSNLP